MAYTFAMTKLRVIDSDDKPSTDSLSKDPKPLHIVFFISRKDAIASTGFVFPVTRRTSGS